MSQNENIINERNEQTQDEMLSALLQKLTPTAKSSSSPTDGTSPGGDIFSALLSNPELISKLPTLLSSIKPIIDMLGVSASTSKAQTSPAALVSAKPSSPADSRSALLSAMKPYLSPERQNAIDYIVKLSRLGDILKTL